MNRLKNQINKDFRLFYDLQPPFESNIIVARAFERSRRVFDIRKHLAHIKQEHRKEAKEQDQKVKKIQV